MNRGIRTAAAVVALLVGPALPRAVRADGPKCFVDPSYQKSLVHDGIELWARRFCMGEGTNRAFSTCPRV